MGLDTCRASPQVVAEDPASEVLITSRVADQNPNTIPASRLMQRWRWITAGSQFPEAMHFLAIPLARAARCALARCRYRGRDGASIEPGGASLGSGRSSDSPLMAVKMAGGSFHRCG